MDNHITCTELTKRFGSRTVIDRLSVTARVGEVTALVGPSGAGKTTLLNMMAGLDRPTSGVVSSPGRRTRSFIFQDFNLLDSMNARDNALLTRRLVGKRVRKKDVDTVFGRLGIDGLQRHFPHQLSGGQQQRVAVARILIAETPYIFADEPTAALDPASTSVVLQSLRAAADSGVAVVMVSHQRDNLRIVDRTVDVVNGSTARVRC